MNKIPFLLLSLLTMPTHAQSLLGSLNAHQNSLQLVSTSTSSTGTIVTIGSGTDVNPSSTSTSSVNVRCESQDQSSLPLAYVTSLIQQKDGKLEFTYDGGNELSIKSPNMISNCNSMIEWTLKQPDIKGQKTYAIEAKIRKGDRCNDVTNECIYLVDKVENGEFKQKDEVVLKPTLKGFEECLRKTGVVANGKVVPGAIYNGTLNEKFQGLSKSAPLMFLSTGPQSIQVGPKYSKKFDYQYGCEHYEVAHPEVKMLLTSEDSERERLDAEAAKLRNCKVEEYGKLAEFIEKYESYQTTLGEVRDRLIYEAVKKSSLAIGKGTAKADDLKVIEDFGRYVVEPKIERARALYEEISDLEGDARSAKEEELVKLLAEISALGKKPYYEASHVMKLMAQGQFDEAEKMNTIRLSIVHNSRLGTMEKGVRQTPGVVAQRVNQEVAAFKNSLEVARTEYKYRTGEEAGNAERYNQEAKIIRNRITNRNAEVMNYMQQLQQRALNYCMSPIRVNPSKCQQETITAMQNTQKWLNERNQDDMEELQVAEENAKKWGELEAQGSRHIAAQRGEEVPAEEPEEKVTQEPEMPRLEQPQEQGPYTFQWNNGMQPQQQQMQQQYQNPYAQYQPQGYYPGQQPFLGQQAYQYPSQYDYYGQANYQQRYQYGYPQQPFNSSYSYYGRQW